MLDLICQPLPWYVAGVLIVYNLPQCSGRDMGIWSFKRKITSLKTNN